MHVSEFYQTPHITAADLRGEEKEVTIAKAVREEVGSNKEMKGVLYFAEFGDRGMVMNKTNTRRVEEMHGGEDEDTDNWIGKKITIYPSETELKGEDVACIRVRKKQ